MTVVLLETAWVADRASLETRATQALATIDRQFPRVMYWNAEHTHRNDPGARFDADTPEAAVEQGGSLHALWCATLKHVGREGIEPEQLVVGAGANADEQAEGIRVFFDLQKLAIQTEEEDLETSLGEKLGFYHEVLRSLGRCALIGGFWLRKHSAFAGDPVWLYQPKIPFAKLYDAIRFDSVVEDVRRVRESVADALKPGDWQGLLEELDLAPEVLEPGRLYLELGDPLEGGGAAALKKIEKRISAALKKK